MKGVFPGTLFQRFLKLNRSLMKSPHDYEQLAVADRKGMHAVMPGLMLSTLKVSLSLW